MDSSMWNAADSSSLPAAIKDMLKTPTLGTAPYRTTRLPLAML